MSTELELNDLFEEATNAPQPQSQAEPKRKVLPAIDGVSEKLDKLLNAQLPALLFSAASSEELKANVRRVDGQIIGTGESDFTKGNSLYALNYKGKAFQLIDVPGIEGDERKYASMVREAVAKAHLVFYVNGTNKKPEKGTAEKIRSYLRRGTQVSPIVNVRGNADTYEFEEDRKPLKSDSGATDALKQTVGVLEAVLNKEVLLPGHCVQGLLAFSSLSMNPTTRETHIHPSRDRDLVIHQRNYLKHFESPKSMFEFSQIQAVAQVLHNKLDTFKEDIIESNKIKVRELLIENITTLQKALEDHQTFVAQLDPEFKKCRESVKEAVKTFERLISAGRKNLWNDFFNSLCERSDEIVAEHFGDRETISSKLKRDFKTRQEVIGEHLKEQYKSNIEVLQTSVGQAMQRLLQDVRRIDFQQRISADDANQKAVYHAAALDMDLGLKGWGSVAFNLGSYALSGAGIGSIFPGIGTAIGALVGGVVGLLVSVMEWFSSKEKRIRKAQSQAQQQIDNVRDKVMGGLDEEVQTLVKPITKEVNNTTLKQIDVIYADLTRPSEIIQKQILLMSDMKNQLEKMPRGTIQTIQR